MPVGFNDDETEMNTIKNEEPQMEEKKKPKKKLTRGQSRALSWANSSKFFQQEITLQDVAAQMASDKKALKLGTHSYRFSKYSNTFTGNVAVNWFLDKSYADNIITAVELGNELVDGELIFPISGEGFRDDSSLYYLPQFTSKDNKKQYKSYSKVRRELVTYLQENVTVKSHKFRHTQYPDTFRGAEALHVMQQWMIENSIDDAMANTWSSFLISDKQCLPEGDEERNAFKVDDEYDDFAVFRWIELSEKTKTALEKREELIKQFEDEKEGIKLSKHKLGLKVISNSTTGADIVRWLVKNGWSSGSTDAIELGTILMQEGVIVSALGDEIFDEEADLFFKLGRDEQKKKNLQKEENLRDREILQAVLPSDRHQYRFTVYNDTFTGKEGVDALISERYAVEREDAVGILSKLAREGYITCVTSGKTEVPTYQDKEGQLWTLISEQKLQHEKLKRKFPGDVRLYEREVLKKGSHAQIKKSTFARLFGIDEKRESNFLDGVFKVFGEGKDTLDRDQFDAAVNTLFEDGDFSKKLEFLFQVMDKEDSGSISLQQVDEFISTSAAVNGFRLPKEKIQHLSELVLDHLTILDNATTNERDEMLEYKDALKTKARRLNKENQSVRGKFKAKASKFAFSKKDLSKDQKKVKTEKDKSDKLFDTSHQQAHPPTFAAYWYLESVKWIWMTFWFFSNLFLFVGGFLVYSIGSKQEEFYVVGWGLSVAKAFSYTIYMNASLILLFISRWYLTILQDYWISHYLPLHKNIVFHRYTALSMMLASYSHGMAHLWDVWVLDGLDIDTVTGILQQGQFDRNPGYITWALGTIPGLTGIIIIISQSLILITAVHKETRRNHFDIFWYTHHFYVPFYICIALHGLGDVVAFPIYWCFLLFPAFTFSAERFRRLYRQLVGTKVVSAIDDERTNVLLLQFEKPPGLQYKAGMFVFINWRSQVTQWHPFTLTSSPLEEHMSVAIKKLGDWTKLIALAFKDVEQSREELSRAVPLAVDGPYGAPAEEFFEYKVVMLVGAGIGITPFASITKDIWLRKKRVEAQLKKKSKKSQTSLIAEQDDENALKHLQKVYLFWLNPNAESFLWFAQLLRDIDNYQGMFKNSTYITRATNQSDVRNWFLNKGLNLEFEKTGIDAITGLKTRTFWGRPDWDKIFEKMTSTYRDQDVGVFFCGAPIISKELRVMCERYTNTSGGARFTYLKENF